MFERSLYVLAFSDGVVKVGSTMPSKTTARTKSHAVAKARTGARIVKAFYSTPTIFGFGAELRAVGRVARYATTVIGREWFHGVTFEQAVQSVEQTIRRMAREEAHKLSAASLNVLPSANKQRSSIVRTAVLAH